MSVIGPSRSIQLLAPQLADQIAAGEVIERPASVVKELIENSLDAAATRVDVEIQRGGMDLIRVTDNGSGIAGAELSLAIYRHATSKIAQLEDLHNLHSLGFRGEALASICSVSQWELASRRAEDELGHQLSYQYQNKPVSLNHAMGTTVSIANLFYNTPARRKFLRSEQTEYRHCEDVICRLVLSRFATAFYIKHNQRQVYRLPSALDDIARTRRVASVLGENVIAHSLVIDFSWQDMRLWGWISRADYSRQQNDLQYFYINGRIIRDRVINHAIRFAYHDSLPPGRHPAYVLFLEVDPQTVDVNVHPTKHEVRFHEMRRVHDFLSRCLRDSIKEKTGSSLYPLPPATTQQGTLGIAMNEQTTRYSPALLRHPLETSSRVGPVTMNHTLLFNRYVLIEKAGQVRVIDAQRMRAHLVTEKLSAHANNDLVTRPLLIPLTIELSEELLRRFDLLSTCLVKLGFEVTRSGPRSIMLRTVPSCLPEMDLAVLLRELWQTIPSEESFTILMAALITTINSQLQQLTLDWNGAAVQGLLQEVNTRDLNTLPANWSISTEQFAQWLAQQHPSPCK